MLCCLTPENVTGTIKEPILKILKMSIAEWEAELTPTTSSRCSSHKEEWAATVMVVVGMVTLLTHLDEDKSHN
jgi:hypothetical protein